jgi:hypothetical protein
MEPAMAPDGSYLVFVSNRPTKPGAAPLDGAINGVVQPGKGANLWRVDRVMGGWSRPMRLPEVVNASSSTYAPSVAANGDLYFMRPDDRTSRFRIFMARHTDQGYDAPVALPFSDGQNTDVDPAVAPDQSFIVFGSAATRRRTSTCSSPFDGATAGVNRHIWAIRSTVLRRMPSLGSGPITTPSTFPASAYRRCNSRLRSATQTGSFAI